MGGMRRFRRPAIQLGGAVWPVGEIDWSMGVPFMGPGAQNLLLGKSIDVPCVAVKRFLQKVQDLPTNPAKSGD
jgi:hypothetical protein